MTIAIAGCITLTLIALLAAIANDVRLNCHRRQSARLWTSQSRIDQLTLERFSAIESARLYDIYARNMADGIFHHARPQRARAAAPRTQVSPRKKGRR